MGDRAAVIFTDEMEISPTVYLHWNGSEVPALLELTKARMEGRGGDLSYTCARFIGICHESIPGNLSLGVFQTDEKAFLAGNWEDISQGDAGVVVVNVNDFSWTAYAGYLSKPANMPANPKDA